MIVDKNERLTKTSHIHNDNMTTTACRQAHTKVKLPVQRSVMSDSGGDVTAGVFAKTLQTLPVCHSK